VFTRGRVYDRAALDELLAAEIKAARGLHGSAAGARSPREWDFDHSFLRRLTEQQNTASLGTQHLFSLA